MDQYDTMRFFACGFIVLSVGIGMKYAGYLYLMYVLQG